MRQMRSVVKNWGPLLQRGLSPKSISLPRVVPDRPAKLEPTEREVYLTRLLMLQGVWRTGQRSVAIVRGRRVDHFNQETQESLTECVREKDSQLQLAVLKGYAVFADYVQPTDLVDLHPQRALVGLTRSEARWELLGSEQKGKVTSWFFVASLPRGLNIPTGVVDVSPPHSRRQGGQLARDTEQEEDLFDEMDEGARTAKAYQPEDNQEKSEQNWVDFLVDENDASTAGKAKKIRIVDIPATERKAQPARKRRRGPPPGRIIHIPAVVD